MFMAFTYVSRYIITLAIAASTCGENEVLNQCPSVCNTDACPTTLDDGDDDEEFCITLCGSPKCECQENYKRDNYGNCIPIQYCREYFVNS